MAVQSIPVGTKFGRLTVIADAEPSIDKHGWKHGRSVVKCDCGNEKTIRNSKLRSKWTKSCGCLSAELSAERCSKRTTHEMTGTPEYSAWSSMRVRCHLSHSKEYKNYGARGIKVCDRWRNSFEAFLEDMGLRPSSDHSIDRIDNNGNYEPGNCRWATFDEQCHNKRTNRMFTFYGKTMTLTQWCRITQIKRRIVMNRLRRGWDSKTAFWKPSIPKPRRKRVGQCL